MNYTKKIFFFRNAEKHLRFLNNSLRFFPFTLKLTAMYEWRESKTQKVKCQTVGNTLQINLSNIPCKYLNQFSFIKNSVAYYREGIVGGLSLLLK